MGYLFFWVCENISKNISQKNVRELAVVVKILTIKSRARIRVENVSM